MSSDGMKQQVERLFDETYYLSICKEARESELEPIDHYIRIGSPKGFNPHPLFSPSFYRKKYKLSEDVEPLVAYLEADKITQPHPLFNPVQTRKLLARIKDSWDREKTILENYLESWMHLENGPIAHFDQDFYLEAHTYVSMKKMNPALHYLLAGERAGHLPNPYFDPSDDRLKVLMEKWEVPNHTTALELLASGKFKRYSREMLAFGKALNQLNNEREKIVFVSHEASKTGAPLIILKVAELFYEKYNYQPIILIEEGGSIQADFQRIGPTYVFENSPYGSRTCFNTELEIVMRVLSGNDYKGVILNSVVSHNFLDHLSGLTKRTMYLIHEFAVSFESGVLDKIGELSDLVVVPSPIIQSSYLSATESGKEKLCLLGQGLLKEDLLTRNDRTEVKTELRSTYGLPDDAIIVLGCGTIDERKGFDLFVQSGIKALQRTNDIPLYFLWVGGQPKSMKNRMFSDWIESDIAHLGFQDKFIFPGEIDSNDAYFLGSDIFFLSSRLDPFPCVMHEAMAAELSVICFEGTGGHSDVFSDGTGIVIPYLNTDQVGAEILRLAENLELRKSFGTLAQAKVKEKYRFDDYVETLHNRFLAIAE